MIQTIAKINELMFKKKLIKEVDPTDQDQHNSAMDADDANESF
jgi:hypothetical protein